MFKVGFCVSGQGRLFRAALELRNELGITPSLVVLDSSADASLAAFAKTADIEVRSIDENWSKDEARAQLSKWLLEPKLDFVSLTFNRLLPADLIRAKTYPILNTHLSLLPAYSGFGALEGAIRDGVKFTGATLHEVNEGADTGPILAQAVVPVLPADTTATLGKRIYGSLEPLFLQSLKWYAEGRVRRDAEGRLWVENARYGTETLSPAIEPAVINALQKRSGS